MLDLCGGKRRIWLRRGEVSQTRMKRAHDQTMPVFTQCALYIEDHNRAESQDTGLKTWDDKECSELSL